MHRITPTVSATAVKPKKGMYCLWHKTVSFSEAPVVITPRYLSLEVGIFVRVLCKSLIDLFKNHSYSMALCAKKKLLRNNYSKMEIWTYNERNSLTSRHKNPLTCWYAVKINQEIIDLFFN